MKQRLIRCSAKNDGVSYYLKWQAKLSLQRIIAVVAPTLALVAAVFAATLFPIGNQIASALTINSLSQTSGPLSGGNEVTISGSGYQATVRDEIKDVKAGLPTVILTTHNRVLISLMQKYHSDENGKNYGYFDINQYSDITSEIGLRDGEYVKEIGVANVMLTNYGRILKGVYSYSNGSVDKFTGAIDVTSKLSMTPGDAVDDVSGSRFNAFITKNGRIIVQTISQANDWFGDWSTAKLVDYTSQLNLAPNDKLAKMSSQLFLTKNGRVFKLGRENANDKEAHFIELTSKFAGKVVDIAGYGNCPIDPSNDCHYFARTANGDVYAWGNNLRGQLGLGDASKSWGGETGSDRVDPEKINFNFNGKVVDMQAGYHGSVLVTDRGTLYYMGQNDDAGQKDENGNDRYVTPLGAAIDDSIYHGNTGHNIKVPTKLKATANVKVKKVYLLGEIWGTASGGPALAQLSDGSVVSWGEWSNLANFGDDSYYRAWSSLNEINLGSVNISNIKSIKFGNTEAKFDVRGNGAIVATVPASSRPGKVDVAITDNSGKTYHFHDGYEYIADTATIRPNKHVTPTAPNTGAK